MAASFIPGEVIAACISALLAAVILLAVGFARNQQRIVRLEEWVRIYERDMNDEEEVNDRPADRYPRG